MKKKFLIPILGAFAFAVAFSFSSRNSSSDDEIISLFIESDNIAYAESGDHCTYSQADYCIIGGTIYSNAKVCNI